MTSHKQNLPMAIDDFDEAHVAIVADNQSKANESRLRQVARIMAHGAVRAAQKVHDENATSVSDTIRKVDTNKPPRQKARTKLQEPKLQEPRLQKPSAKTVANVIANALDAAPLGLARE